MPLHIRPETASDIPAVRTLTIAAFKQISEANLNDTLRNNGNALISLVAEQDNQVVAHIMFSPVTIQDEDRTHHSVGLGPVAVTPALHGQGIGSAIVCAGLDACRSANYPHVFLTGHTTYYPRFGFLPASDFGISYKGRAPFPAFMCIELTKDSLADIHGSLTFGPEFYIDP